MDARTRAELEAFRAEHLEDKLINLCIVRDPGEALALFQEVKRYMALLSFFPRQRIAMVSVRVDEVFHQFMLFTSEYAAFCERFFGHFVHHTPREGDASAGGKPNPQAFEAFKSMYEQVFGALPDVWFDHKFLGLNTCLRAEVRRFQFAVQQEREHALLIDARHELLLCRVSVRAAPALQFMVDTPKFFIRELPALHSEVERLQLCQPLVQYGVLKVCP